MNTRETRFVVLVCLAVIVLVAVPKEMALRYVCPFRYREVVLYEAYRSHIDPLLVAAMARVESNFDPAAVSPKGAVGLMQVMPQTGAWVAERLELRDWQEHSLADPRVNIQIGIWYLSYLIKMFDGEPVLAVAAYNSGFNNVRRWLQEGVWDGTHENHQHIPFPETRQYVHRVFRTYEWYQLAYPHIPSGSDAWEEFVIAGRSVN